MEETLFDPVNGLPVIRNLADYHVPSCADTPDITIEVLGIPDPNIGQLGAHGVGEMGCNGVPPAITNAIYNATGKRLRSLPVTPDKVLESLNLRRRSAPSNRTLIFMPDNPTKHPVDEVDLTRRTFLGAAGFVAVAAVMAKAAPLGGGHSQVDLPSGHIQERYAFRVNEQNHLIPHDDRITVLDALREQIGLTGTKKGCDHGQCGACTIHLDGQRALSCLLLVAAVQGREIRTIEGLTDSQGNLHPMQQAFIDHDAFQCGYCTPGQIMSAVACVEEGHAGSPAEIQEFMSGNLCRCAAYPNIVAAIGQARKGMGG